MPSLTETFRALAYQKNIFDIEDVYLLQEISESEHVSPSLIAFDEWRTANSERELYEIEYDFMGYKNDEEIEQFLWEESCNGGVGYFQLEDGRIAYTMCP